jgi:hypothetical protein
MGVTNTDAYGFSSGNMGFSYPPGNMAGDGPSRTHNPIPADAPTISTVNSQPVQSNVSNPGIAVTPPNAGRTLITTKDSTGKTTSVRGLISGTSIVFNNPG